MHSAGWRGEPWDETGVNPDDRLEASSYAAVMTVGPPEVPTELAHGNPMVVPGMVAGCGCGFVALALFGALGAYAVTGDCFSQEACPSVHFWAQRPVSFLGAAAAVSLGLWVGLLIASRHLRRLKQVALLCFAVAIVAEITLLMLFGLK
jgi:hypothetical protein